MKNTKQIKNNYLKAIFTHFEDKELKAEWFDNSVTSTKLFNNYNELINQGNLSDTDKKIIDSFSKNIKTEIDEGQFKAMSNFLNKKTGIIKKAESINLLALLLDFKPRPQSMFRKKINDNIEVENNKLLKTLIIIGIFALLVYILTTLFRVYNSPNIITINNFNTSNNYYYYQDGKSLKLVEKSKIPKSKIVDYQPVTPKILDLYFVQQNIDTTQATYKTIKLNYFKKTKYPVIDVDTGMTVDSISMSGPIKNTGKPQKIIHKTLQTKPIKTAKQSLQINILDNGNEDMAMSSLLRKHFQHKNIHKITGKTQYSYSKSTLLKGRYVCNLILTYQTNTGIEQSFTIKGNGITKESARNNALYKAEIMLKN